MISNAREQDVWWSIGRATLGVFAKMAFRLRVLGARNVPATGGALLAYNHISVIDAVFVALPVIDRVKAGIRRFSKPLADLVARDANEGDTRLLVTDFLCEVLGYDKYEDLTTEYQVKGEFADYGIRVDRQLVAFIEVKRVATKLSMKHFRQVEMYAVNEGVEWVILCNGPVWRAYHLDVSHGLPVVIDLAMELDLLGQESSTHKANQLFCLTRESFKKGRIDELWKQKVATSPRALAVVVTSDSVANAIRKELWRQTGQRLEAAEVVQLLKDTVLRPEALA